MKTVFLIDYENVNNVDRLRFPALSESGNSYECHVFYSDANCKINMDIFQYFGKNIWFHKCEQGDQNMDMHIASFLGMKISKSTTHNNYVIVSADAHYDGIIRTWNSTGKATVARRQTVADAFSVQLNIPGSLANTQAAPSERPVQINASVENIQGTMPKISPHVKNALNIALLREYRERKFIMHDQIVHLIFQNLDNVPSVQKRHEAVISALENEYGVETGDVYSQIAIKILTSHGL